MDQGVEDELVAVSFASLYDLERGNIILVKPADCDMLLTSKSACA